MRIGFGYDSHRFEKGRRLVLGGVEFLGEDGLAGHSDADVVIHALIDALLGAAALGDIGSKFPDTDERWKDADSADMLATVIRDVRAAGYAVGNVDIAIICERPKIRPFAELIRERLAHVMNVGKGRISVKGKTNEGMDDVGRSLGIVVHAVCLLEEAGRMDPAMSGALK